MKYPVTTADFLIEDPFSRFSGKDKLKSHPKKIPKNLTLRLMRAYSKKIAKKKIQKNSKKGCRPPNI